MPNWAEQVTAVATAVSALGLLSAIGAVIFAGQQAREARIGRQATPWLTQPLRCRRRSAVEMLICIREACGSVLP